MTEILYAIIAGAVVGALARMVLPGRQDISILVTILLGIAGAVVGDLLYGAMGGGVTSGVDWLRWFVRVGVGALFVYLFVMLRSRRS